MILQSAEASIEHRGHPHLARRLIGSQRHQGEHLDRSAAHLQYRAKEVRLADRAEEAGFLGRETARHFTNQRAGVVFAFRDTVTKEAGNQVTRDVPVALRNRGEKPYRIAAATSLRRLA